MNILTQTSDGSYTLFNEEIGEHYHSAHGALQESKHVFIEAGLKYGLEKSGQSEINILEVGFGTGLNFLLTYAYCENENITLNYTGIEAFPLTKEVLSSPQYQQYVPPDLWDNFIANYESAIKTPVELSKHCTLKIAHSFLQDFNTTEKFDVLYYDAFSVRHQPELWTEEVIGHACSFLKQGGVFITYAITGNLKKALQQHGLEIEKLPGAPGKREMLRGVKTV